MGLPRQIWVLMAKNFRIILRQPVVTLLTAFILPIALTGFFSFAKNLFVPPATFGIGSPRSVMSLGEALNIGASSGRNKLLFVNDGLSGGLVDSVINAVVPQVTAAGALAVRLTDPSDLVSECPSNLNGVTNCFAAVIFVSSFDEGDDSPIWNYTVRVDSALTAFRINVNDGHDDAEVYLLPLQRTVDSAIFNVTASRASLSPSSFFYPSNHVMYYPYTDLTPDQRDDKIREIYQTSITNFAAVFFVTCVLFVTYHLTGFIATERESGMAQLVDAMMPVRRPWYALVVRQFANHISFSLVYLPGWIICSLVLQHGVFPNTNVAIVLIYHILSGLAFISLSIMVASGFRKAQLSGNSAVLGCLLLGILAQVLTLPSTVPVVMLSLLFTPCNYVYFISYLARWEHQGLAANLAKSSPDSPSHVAGVAFWIFLILQIIIYPIIGALIERTIHGTSTRSRVVSNEPLGEDAVQLDNFTKVYPPSFYARLTRRSASSTPSPSAAHHGPSKSMVVAVDGLTLNIGLGQIFALLGANGSGKSTTLDCIAGLNKLTSGSIHIDGTGGLGIAPQKNVLWDDLTVLEHIMIFNRLKTPDRNVADLENLELVRSIDLEPKIKARSKTLSGGQKRKLQLGMMLAGGSAVCLVDEVSSGLDPISRRKIWDILLAERGRRTLIMTTHFLDEADLLADRIAILSKGTLRAHGSSAQLKDTLGGGYRVFVRPKSDVSSGSDLLQPTPDVDGVQKTTGLDEVTYLAPSSALAATVIRALDAVGLQDYRFSGPTIEDVFLEVAEEVRADDKALVADVRETTATSALNRGSWLRKFRKSENGPNGAGVENADADPTKLELLDGKRIGYLAQATVLWRKRLTVLKRNWVPYLAAFLLLIIAASLVTLFLHGQQRIGCNPADQASDGGYTSSISNSVPSFVYGPSSQAHLLGLLVPVLRDKIAAPVISSGESAVVSSLVGNISALVNVSFVDTLDDFKNFVTANRRHIEAGIWMGDNHTQPLFTYQSDGSLLLPLVIQGALGVLETKINITVNSDYFDVPFIPSTGNNLQLLTYMGIALSIYPSFFALYPSVERRRFVRSFQYSNGVRPFPLWLSYLVFDFAIVFVTTSISIGIWAGLSSIWWNLGYVYIVFLLYGLASIVLAYLCSLFGKTQLFTFALASIWQLLVFLAYVTAVMSVISFSPVVNTDRDLHISSFVISAISPVGPAIHAIMLTTNLFSAACDGKQFASHPADIIQFGGAILYLILQSIFYFALLVWIDSGSATVAFNIFWSYCSFRRYRQSPASRHSGDFSDEEMAGEINRVTSNHQRQQIEKQAGASVNWNRGTNHSDGKVDGSSDGNAEKKGDGLQIVHVSKSFGKTTAVDDVTFGIKRGEVFALLGPNGAGKSTLISLIRGDIQPTGQRGDIFVEDQSVTVDLAAARANLGVCPQVDAVDIMTVREHLEFYARIRGVPSVEHNVQAVLAAVGLGAFADRMAQALSGGNRRKLSLGIALMGNPAVVLLDEPSSGLDAAAKRIMWSTLAATVAGRSILLTTHSMEEASALAGHVGILSKRMLAMGTIDSLRLRFGDLLYVHLVCRSAPRTTAAEMAAVTAWIRRTFAAAATVDDDTYHGQIRFTVSAAAVLSAAAGIAVPTPLPHVPPSSSSTSPTISPTSPDAAVTVHEAPPMSALDHDEAIKLERSAIAKLVVLLEENKDELEIGYYSVSPTTLDQVFLAIVGRYNVQEESERR